MIHRSGIMSLKVYSCDRCGVTLARVRHTVGSRMADAAYTGDLSRLWGYDLAAYLYDACHVGARRFSRRSSRPAGAETRGRRPSGSPSPFWG